MNVMSLKKGCFLLKLFIEDRCTAALLKISCFAQYISETMIVENCLLSK